MIGVALGCTCESDRNCIKNFEKEQNGELPTQSCFTSAQLAIGHESLCYVGVDVKLMVTVNT